jgi:hypothetical protein
MNSVVQRIVNNWTDKRINFNKIDIHYTAVLCLIGKTMINYGKTAIANYESRWKIANKLTEGTCWVLKLHNSLFNSFIYIFWSKDIILYWFWGSEGLFLTPWPLKAYLFLRHKKFRIYNTNILCTLLFLVFLFFHWNQNYFKNFFQNPSVIFEDLAATLKYSVSNLYWQWLLTSDYLANFIYNMYKLFIFNKFSWFFQ